eukprot:snap_masked-scaffold_1-processed-gene-24.45-mRNA-1 protein AED:1.00 eAED:1.00 QI:0/0/0/0/1/1/2/0/259
MRQRIKRQVFWSKLYDGDNVEEKEQKDNHVDEKYFFSELKINANYVRINYNQYFYQSFFFISQFHLLNVIYVLGGKTLDRNLLNIVDSGLIAGSILFTFSAKNFPLRSIMYAALVFFFTPVLRSLTLNYSDDTLVELVWLVSFIHLLTFDYEYYFIPNAGAKPNCVFSYSMLFCSLLLVASRFGNDFDAIRFILEGSLLSFAWSQTALKIFITNRLYFVSMNTILTLAICLLYSNAPIIIKSFEKQKYIVEGPWDIAEL